MALFSGHVGLGTDRDLFWALEEVDHVMHHGDNKYGKNAWKEGKQSSLDHALGVQRHLRRYFRDEKRDKDSGLRALAHVAARALIALQLEIDKDHKEEPPTYTHDMNKGAVLDTAQARGKADAETGTQAPKENRSHDQGGGGPSAHYKPEWDGDGGGP